MRHPIRVAHRFVTETSERLDSFLARMDADGSRSKWAEAIAQGKVRVDGAVVAKAGMKLRPGMVVEADPLPESAPHDLTPADIPLRIVYEDDLLLVVDKPRGLAAHPASSLKEPSLVNALLARGSEWSASESFRPGIVHRLDKETTGLMVVAKTDAAHAALSRQFEKKTADRRYLGIVAGRPDRDRFDIDAPIARDRGNRQRMAVDPQGKPAVTHCLVLGQAGPGTLMAFRLSTGRTHQIRVHLRAIGNPILGDKIYAPKNLQAGPLQLHAAYLSFEHPGDRRTVEWYAPPPPDFQFSGEIPLNSLRFSIAPA